MTVIVEILIIINKNESLMKDDVVQCIVRYFLSCLFNVQ